MAETLKKVNAGEIAIEELLQWLSSSSRTSSDSRFTELKADFVINFINHLRDCSTWLVPNLYVSASNKSVILRHHDACENSVSKLTSKTTPGSQKKKNRVLLPLSIGCGSYENIRNKTRSGKYKQSGVSQDENKQFINVHRKLLLDNFEEFPSITNNVFDKKTNIVSLPPNVSSVKVLPDKCSKNNSLNYKFSSENPNSHNTGRKTKKCSIISSQLAVKSSEQNEISKSVHSENFLKSCDNSLLQRRLEPNSSQLKSLTIQPFPKPTYKLEESSLHYTLPSLKNLHNEEKLYLYEKIYNILFTLGLVPSISSELYFLFQLLTSCVKADSLINYDHILSTTDNCIHFAVTSLYEHKNILTLLDKTTLKLVQDIPHLKDFSFKLNEFILTHINEKTVVRTKRKSSINNVPYNEDTDTRSNFPSEESFSSFSKQRNLFYDILTMWDAAKKNSGFDVSFEKRFVEKVHLLIDLSVENFNYYHLAQLFHKQLKVSCLYDVETLDGFVKNESSFHFKNCQSLKLFKRLSIFTQTDSNSLNWTSHETQMFFEAFLLAASSVPLNDYLLDLLGREIMELNNPDNFSEIHKRSIEETHEKFSTVLHSLRLMARFYGFIIFMSYRSPKPLPKRLIPCQTELRKYTRPTLDFEKILTIAIKKQCLVITVPWIVEYLSMMDQVAPTLDQYLDICKMLVKIYRGYVKDDMSKINFEFIRLIIGSLIETSNFPLECLFYNYEFPKKDNSERLDTKLDFQNVVDKQLVYSCCPALAELKLLIDNFWKGAQSNNQEINKISSKSTTLWQDSDQLTVEQNLEVQMEENFFFSHPVILKQTVDFVTERITSHVIHQICKTVENMKTKVVADIIGLCKEKNQKDLSFYYPYVAIESEKLCVNTKQWVKKMLKKQKDDEENVFNEVKEAITQLLSEEVDTKVNEMASRIAARMVAKKVLDWIDSNIVAEKVTSNVKSKVQKTLSDDDNSPFVFNDDEIVSLECMTSRLPYDYLRSLQKLVLEFDNEFHDHSLDTFLELCSEMKIAIIKNYLPFYVIEAIVWLTIDIVLTLFISFPETCTTRVVETVVDVLVSCPSKLVSPLSFLNRQILFKIMLKNNVACWKNFILLFEFAVKKKLLLSKDVIEHISNLYSSEWAESYVCQFDEYFKLIISVLENINH